MNKFIKLYESTISRFTRGGFLTGDIVKFVDGAFNDDFFKNQASNYVQKARSFNEGGLTLRVSAIKTVRPSTQPGNIQNAGDSFLVDVTQEIAPGLFREFLTIPAHLLQTIDTYPNLAPIPDSLVRHGDTNIAPKTVDIKDSSELMSSPHRQTLTSDLGDKKDSDGDRALSNTNTTIPSSPAVDARTPSVEKGTSRYLPKR